MSNSTNMEQRVNREIEELKAKFEKMMRPHSLRPTGSGQENYLAITPVAATSNDGAAMDNPMDLPSRIRAIRVFNVMLTRLWRRRCAEVNDLHELVRQYQTKANNMRLDLLMRNNLISREQRRCEHLEAELRRMKGAAERNSNSCDVIDEALKAARRQEAQLRQDLRDKTQECNNFEELLSSTKTDMFRELAKYRKCAQELASQQRQNCVLELRNTELEDELLTIKDRFQTQHDKIAVAVHMEQEKLDDEYEALKGYEEELANLEMQHNELLKETQNADMQEELDKLKQKIGMMRYIIWFILARRLPNLKQVAYEVIARFMDYMLNNHQTLPTPPGASVGIVLAVMLLMGAFY